MSKLKPCPCGKTPQRLSLYDTGQGGKWFNVCGSCCNEWSIEFRAEYNDVDSTEAMKLAIEAWNEAPRRSND